MQIESRENALVASDYVLHNMSVLIHETMVQCRHKITHRSMMCNITHESGVSQTTSTRNCSTDELSKPIQPCPKFKIMENTNFEVL